MTYALLPISAALLARSACAHAIPRLIAMEARLVAAGHVGSGGYAGAEMAEGTDVAEAEAKAARGLLLTALQDAMAEHGQVQRRVPAACSGVALQHALLLYADDLEAGVASLPVHGGADGFVPWSREVVATAARKRAARIGERG